MNRILKAAALLAAVAVLFAGAASGSARVFTDVPADHEAAGAFNLLKELQIYLGYPDGSASPGGTVRRDEFCAVVVRMIGHEELAGRMALTQPAYRDEIPSWAWGYVNVATWMEIIGGYGDNTFRASNPVTFAEAFAMLARALKVDKAATGAWPLNYVILGALMDLDANLTVRPNHAMTRAEMALATRNALVARWTYEDGVGLKSGNSLLEQAPYHWPAAAVDQLLGSTPAVSAPTPAPGDRPGPLTASSSKPTYWTTEDIIIFWTTSTDAVRYDLTITKPPYGSSNAVYNNAHLTGNSVNIGRLPVGDYRCQMRGYNASGVGGEASNVVHFEVKAASTAPPPLTVSSSKPTYWTTEDIVIFWITSTDAVRYALTITKPPYGSSNAVYNNAHLTGNSVNIGRLPVGDYRFQMRGYNAEGVGGEASNLVYFKVEVEPTPEPLTVASTKAAYLTDEDIVVSWTTSKNAVRYALTVRKPPYTGESSIVLNLTQLTGNSANIGRLPAGDYRFAMRGYNASGVGGEASKLVYFSVQAPIASPVEGPFLYWQADPQWGSLKNACGIASYAMLISNRAGKSVTPKDVYEANGKTVWMPAWNEYANQSNRILRALGLNYRHLREDVSKLTQNQKIARAKELLTAHPTGLMVGMSGARAGNQLMHFLVFLLLDGDLYVCDPATEKVKSGPVPWDQCYQLLAKERYNRDAEKFWLDVGGYHVLAIP